MKRAAMFLLWLAACGDDDAPRDAGALGDVEEDASSLLEIASPAEPAAPRPPDFSGCPDGWVRTEERCEAQPQRDCPPGTMQRPDEVDCVAIGPPCPAGPYPEDIPSGRSLVYVLEGGGGDGTREAPFGTIGEALVAAPSGALIVVGQGTYPEAPIIERSIDLLGACVAGTVIEPSGVSREGVVVDGDIDVDLARLTVRAGQGVAITERDGARLDLREVELDASNLGLEARDSRLRAYEISVRARAGMDAYSSACVIEDSALYGRSPDAQSGSLELHRVRIAANALGSGGVRVLGAEAHLEQVSIRAIGPILLTFGAQLTVDFLSGEGESLLASLTGGSSRLSHVAFRSERTDVGAVSLEGGTAELRDVDIVVEQALAPPALDIHEGARLEIERVRVTGRSETAVVASGECSIEGTDLTLEGPGVGRGFGLSAIAGGSISLERVLVENSGFGGVLAAGGTMELTDLVVRDAGLAYAEGWGVLAWQGGTISLERALIEGCRGVGLLAVDPGSELIGSDVQIRDPRPSLSGDYGRGIEASAGGSIALSRAVIESSREHGVLCSGAEIALTDVRIVDALARGCAETTCADRPYGVGVSAYDGEVTLERFEVRRAALCGLHLGEGGRIVASDGLVAESTVGLCAGDGDAAGAIDSVRYEDNGATFSGLRLPVPEPITPDS